MLPLGLGLSGGLWAAPLRESSLRCYERRGLVSLPEQMLLTHLHGTGVPSPILVFLSNPFLSHGKYARNIRTSE